eukprot:SAG11_NODE_19208_length_471_cov_13.935484_1_plen_38_part_10
MLLLLLFAAVASLFIAKQLFWCKQLTALTVLVAFTKLA